MPASTVVSLVAKLSIAAFKARLDKESVLWYCLGALNHRGSGRPGLEEAADTLVSWLGYSASMACRALAGDDGLFWAKRLMININSLQVEI